MRSGGHLLGLTLKAEVWQPAHGCQCVACGLRRVCCLQLAATLQAQLQQLQQAMLSDSAAEAALQQQLSASQAMGLQAQRELQAAHQQVQELREGQGQLQGKFGTCSGEGNCMCDGKVDIPDILLHRQRAVCPPVHHLQSIDMEHCMCMLADRWALFEGKHGRLSAGCSVAQVLRSAVLALAGEQMCCLWVMCQHSGACWQAGVRHGCRHGRLWFLAACRVLSGSGASQRCRDTCRGMSVLSV